MDRLRRAGDDRVKITHYRYFLHRSLECAAHNTTDHARCWCSPVAIYLEEHELPEDPRDMGILWNKHMTQEPLH